MSQSTCHLNAGDGDSEQFRHWVRVQHDSVPWNISMWLSHGHPIAQARNLGVFLGIFSFLTLHQTPGPVPCLAQRFPVPTLAALVSLGSAHSHSRFSKTQIWSEVSLVWVSGWESACQCRDHGFDPQAGRMPHAMGNPSLCPTNH